MIKSETSIPQLNELNEPSPLLNFLLPYTFKWRQKQLWVSKCFNVVEQQNLPVLEIKQWLINCLKNSSVRLVCIDPHLDAAELRLWANACQQTNKKIFLKVPFSSNLLSRNPVAWWLRRVIDLSIATLLLLILSPLMLALVLLIRIYSSDHIFCRQWCVGGRGKLYQVLKFCTKGIDTDNLDSLVIDNQSQPDQETNSSLKLLSDWLCKYRLDDIPQLVNVLRGEMSLIGRYPWTLEEAKQLNLREQKLLRTLPGIFEIKQLNLGEIA